VAFRQDEHRVSRSCESGCARYRVKRVLWLVPLIRVMQSKDGKLSAVGEVFQRWQRPIIRLIGGVVLTTLRADLSKNVDNYQTGMLDAVAPFLSFGAAVVRRRLPRPGTASTLALTRNLRSVRVLCFSFLIVRYIADAFPGNDHAKKWPRILDFRQLGNIWPRARAQEHPSSLTLAVI